MTRRRPFVMSWPWMTAAAATWGLGVGINWAFSTPWAWFAYAPYAAVLVAYWRIRKHRSAAIADDYPPSRDAVYRHCCTSRIGFPHDPRCKELKK